MRDEAIWFTSIFRLSHVVETSHALKDEQVTWEETSCGKKKKEEDINK